MHVLGGRQERAFGAAIGLPERLDRVEVLDHVADEADRVRVRIEITAALQDPGVDEGREAARHRLELVRVEIGGFGIDQTGERQGGA